LSKKTKIRQMMFLYAQRLTEVLDLRKMEEWWSLLWNRINEQFWKLDILTWY
jgi:hypothetical protein